jgi:hypothetical protein
MQNAWKNWHLDVETTSLVSALEEIIVDVEGNFVIEDSFEDVHSK